MTKPDITIGDLHDAMLSAVYANGLDDAEPDDMRRALNAALTTANITPEQLIALARGEAFVVPRDTPWPLDGGLKEPVPTKCLRDPEYDNGLQGPCSAGQCQWPECAALKARP